MAQIDRIPQDPVVMGAKPCIRGMRGGGHDRRPDWSGPQHRGTPAGYPYLERQDILQALRYAAKTT